MILKVVQVEGVGRLRRLTWGKGVGQAGSLVGVHAENGAGKTTLVAAFRSARTGNVTPLRERRTLPSSVPQRIHLLAAEGRNLKFDGAGWSETMPAIEIFDRAFVESTVYDGSEVSADQRQQLFRLALGEGDAEAARRVDGAKRTFQAADKALREVERRLQDRCEVAATTLADVQAATPLATPPDGHSARESRLRALTEQINLGALPLPIVPAAPISLDVERLRALMDESATSVSAEAAEAVQRHITDRLDTEGEAWLREGTRYARAGAECPYCRHDLSSSEFARVLADYFDEAYAALQRRLANAADSIRRWDEWLQTLLAIELENERARGAWSPLLPPANAPRLDKVKELVRTLEAMLRDLIAEKVARPLETLGQDTRVPRIADLHRELEGLFSEYVTWATNLQADAQRVLGKRDEELRRLKSEVSLVRAQLLRGTAAMERALDDYARTVEGFKAARRDLDEAEAELAQRESQRTGAFADRVNRILADFGAGFRFTDLEGKPSTARVTADFCIELTTGGRVKASSKTADAPRFATVLSDGDRTTLALAVFIARCEDSGITGRVIVLDDPISSLDTRRRRATMEVLRRLHARHAQIWVLSHDEHFLRHALPGDATWLCIQHHAEGASLEEWNPAEHCKSMHWQNVDRLQAFHERHPRAPHHDDAWRILRPVLEHYLKYRFPRAWSGDEWLWDFVKKGRDGHPAVRLSAEDLERVASLCRFCSPSLHADPRDAGPPPKEDEIRSVVATVLDFIQS